MPLVGVRRPLPDDLVAAGEVCVAAYEPFTLGASDFYVDQLRDVARRDREAEVWVAVDSGPEDHRVLGCVTACPPGSPWGEIATGPEEGEFRMLAVDPAAQGRGVGAALVERCEASARDHGASGMVLSTLATMTAAHRLYERLGYRREPTRDWAPKPKIDLIAYVKDLR